MSQSRREDNLVLSTTLAKLATEHRELGPIQEILAKKKKWQLTPKFIETINTTILHSPTIQEPAKVLDRAYHLFLWAHGKEQLINRQKSLPYSPYAPAPDTNREICNTYFSSAFVQNLNVLVQNLNWTKPEQLAQQELMHLTADIITFLPEGKAQEEPIKTLYEKVIPNIIKSASENKLQVITFDSKQQPDEVEKQKVHFIRYALTYLEDPDQQSLLTLLKQVFQAELNYYAGKPDFAKLPGGKMEAKQESKNENGRAYQFASDEQITNVQRWVKNNLLAIEGNLLRKVFINVLLLSYGKELKPLGLEQVVHLISGEKRDKNSSPIQRLAKLFRDIQDGSNEEAKINKQILDLANAIITTQKKEETTSFMTDLAKTRLAQEIQKRKKEGAAWQESAYDSISELAISPIQNKQDQQLASLKLLFTELAIERHLKKIDLLRQSNDLQVPLNLNKELNNINLTLKHYLTPPVGKLNKREAMLFIRLIGKIADISSLFPTGSFEGAKDILQLNKEYIKQVVAQFPEDPEIFTAMTSEITKPNGYNYLVDFAIKELGDYPSHQKEMLNKALLCKIDLDTKNGMNPDKLLEECNLYSSNPIVKQAFIRMLLQHETLQLSESQFQTLAFQLGQQSIADVINSYQQHNNERVAWLQSIQAWNKTRILAEYLHRPEEEQEITDLVTHLVEFNMEERKNDEDATGLLENLKQNAVDAIKKKIDISAFSSINKIAASLTNLANDNQKQKECLHRVQVLLNVIEPGLENLKKGGLHIGDIVPALKNTNKAIAAVIKGVYQTEDAEYKEEKSDNYISLKKIIETASDLGIKNLMVIGLENLETDSDCQTQFIYELCLHRLQKMSIEEAHMLIAGEHNKTVKNGLYHAILMHKDIDQLSELKLANIAINIIPAALEKIQKRNSKIVPFLTAYMNKTYQEALRIAERLKHMDEFGFKKLLALLQELSENITQLDPTSLSRLKGVIDKDIIDLLPEIAANLKQGSADIADDKNREKKAGAIEAAEAVVKNAPPPAFLDFKLAQLDTLQRMEIKQSVETNIDYFLSAQEIISLLFIIGDIKPEDFEKIIDRMLDRSGMPYLRMICTGHDPVTKHKIKQGIQNQKAKEFVINHLLHKNMQDDQETVDDLVDSHGNPPALYKTFSTLSNPKTKLILALAILKNPHMRKWLLGSATHEEYLAITDTITSSLNSKSPPDLKALFAHCTLDEFYAAVSKALGKLETQAWIRCGALSNDSIVSELTGQGKLDEQVKQINVHLLSVNQLMALSKQVRIAYLNSFESWEACKLILSNGEQSPAGNARILKIGEAFTHDFNANDIDKLENGAGLILAFKKQYKKVTDKIKQTPHLKKIGWQILEELDPSGVLEQKTNQSLHEQIDATTESIGTNCRHDLVQASFYQADGTYPLKYNTLVNFDLKVNRYKFLRDASPLALVFAFSDLKFVLAKHNLDDDLEQIARRGFPAAELIKCVAQIQSQSEKILQKPALIKLLQSLPEFLKYTTQFKEDDVQAMIALCNLHKETFQGQNNTLIEALKKNRMPASARQVLGSIIFSDQNALTDHFNQTKDYEVPNFWLVEQLIFIFKCMFAAILAGAVWDGLKYFVHGFNPLNWIRGSSPLQTGASYMSAAAVALAASLAGIGISPVAAGLLVPVIMGAAGFIAGGLIVSTVWTGIKTLGNFISQKWAEAFGDPASKSQQIMETIQYGLNCNQTEFITLLKKNADFRKAVGKTLSFAYDNGVDITQNNFPDPQLRELLTLERGAYRNSQRYFVTKLFLNVLATALILAAGIGWWGFGFRPPFYVQYKANQLREKIEPKNLPVSSLAKDIEMIPLGIPLYANRSPELSLQQQHQEKEKKDKKEELQPEGYSGDDYKHSTGIPSRLTVLSPKNNAPPVSLKDTSPVPVRQPEEPRIQKKGGVGTS